MSYFAALGLHFAHKNQWLQDVKITDYLVVTVNSPRIMVNIVFPSRLFSLASVER